MASIFTQIIRGTIPSYRVYEDDEVYAFLDISPIQPGHTLVIPKREVDYLFDLSEAEYTQLWLAVRKVEAALKKATGCQRVVLMVVGYEVPHAHIHLIPTNQLADYPLPERKTLLAEDARALLSQIEAVQAAEPSA